MSKQQRNYYDFIANYCENWQENAPPGILVALQEDAFKGVVMAAMTIAYQDAARIARVARACAEIEISDEPTTEEESNGTGS